MKQTYKPPGPVTEIILLFLFNFMKKQVHNTGILINSVTAKGHSVFQYTKGSKTEKSKQITQERFYEAILAMPSSLFASEFRKI
jgi:hypothetical protein